MKKSLLLVTLYMLSLVSFSMSISKEITYEEAQMIDEKLSLMINLKVDSLEIYKQYLIFYDKEYTSYSEEGQMRLPIFNLRVEAIRAHNSDPTNTWRIGLDQYSDLTREEFKKIFPTVDKKDNLNASYFNTAGLSIIEYYPDKSKMIYRPIDWSAKTGKVFRQGNCGGCYALSSTNAMETNYSIATGEPFKNYSRQQIIDCSIYTHGCNGGDKRLVPGYSNIYGMIPEENYPFTEKNGNCQYTLKKNLAKKITNGMELTNSVINKENCGKHGLYDALTRGVVVVSIDANPIQGYKEGILNLQGRCRESNHAVLVVGYGVQGSTEYWIIKNTWGETFGYKGLAKIQIFDNPNDQMFNCYLQCDFVRPFFEK